MAPRQWTRDDDKRFETLLVQFPENFPNRFETIADILQIPLEEVIYHYEALVYDIAMIESGQVDIPDYPETSGTISFPSKHMVKNKKRWTPWSEEEHRLFLLGLEKFGKGDWKSISREHVWTRTPMQIAGHAHAFFMRQNLDNKSKKRPSIHDTTLVNAGGSSGSNAPNPIFGASTSTQSSSPLFGFSSTTPQQSVSGNSAHSTTAPPPNTIGFNNNQEASSTRKNFKPEKPNKKK